MDLGLEMDPRLGPLCPPLIYVQVQGFPMFFPRTWGLICLSQVPPDKPLSFWSSNLLFLSQLGDVSHHDSSVSHVNNQSLNSPSLVVVLATGTDSHGHTGCAGCHGRCITESLPALSQIPSADVKPMASPL